MGNMTLKEVCNEVGVSRRAIQGYEKLGLVQATGKMKRGYLLYDEDMILRIRTIKMYQNAGFQLKQIKGIIDEPAEVRKAALEGKITKLQKKKEELDETIEQIEAFLESL